VRYFARGDQGTHAAERSEHHTYTYLIGDDPEVITPRPADIPTLLGQFFGIGIIKPGPIINHALGIIPPADKELVPESERNGSVGTSSVKRGPMEIRFFDRRIQGSGAATKV